MNNAMEYRVILYHKQATSARTRFMRFSHGSVLAFEPIPKLAQLYEAEDENTVLHPAAALKAVEERLGLPDKCLVAEAEFQHCMDVPGNKISVILAGITTMDPPFDAAEQYGAVFIDLTQARDLPDVELDLLRSAYEVLLGG